MAFAGAGEALFWAMQLFVEPGDHVIVTMPNYQSIESIPGRGGVSTSTACHYGTAKVRACSGHSTSTGSSD